MHQKKIALLLFLSLSFYCSLAQSAKGYTYSILKYLEYPNKNSNIECYVSLPRLYGTDTLKLIMNNIRSEKRTVEVSVFFHFVKGKNVVCRVRDRFQVGLNTYKDNLKFYSDTVSGRSSSTIGLIKKSDTTVVIQNIIGLWQYQLNDKVVFFIDKKIYGGFILKTFDVCEKKSY